MRKARGLTQVQLAEKLGVVQSRIAAIKRKPETGSVAGLFEMLAALDVQLVLRKRAQGRRLETLASQVRSRRES